MSSYCRQPGVHWWIPAWKRSILQPISVKVSRCAAGSSSLCFLIIFRNRMICCFLNETWERTSKLSEALQILFCSGLSLPKVCPMRWIIPAAFSLPFSNPVEVKHSVINFIISRSTVVFTLFSYLASNYHSAFWSEHLGLLQLFLNQHK